MNDNRNLFIEMIILLKKVNYSIINNKMKIIAIIQIAVLALFLIHANAQIGPSNTCIGPTCNDHNMCTPTTLRDSVV